MLFDPEGSSASVAEPDPVVEELKMVDVNSMTPIEALNKLSELQKKAGNGGE